MTDARVPERYLMDRRIVRLSDGDFRSFVMATVWSVSNRTEGFISAEDLPLIPGFKPTAPAALTAAEVWSVVPDGWCITDFAATQTTKAQLEAAESKRMNDRERQARHRKKDVHFEATPDDDPREVTRDVTREDKGKASARQGQAEYLEPVKDSKTEPQPVEPVSVVNTQTGEVTDPQPARWESYVDNGTRKRRKVAA